MSIPLDLLIDFKGNEFEFSNAVSSLSLRIHQANKKENQLSDREVEEVIPRPAVKLTSEAFEAILTNKVAYHRPAEGEA